MHPISTNYILFTQTPHHRKWLPMLKYTIKHFVLLVKFPISSLFTFLYYLVYGDDPPKQYPPATGFDFNTGNSFNSVIFIYSSGGNKENPAL